MILFGYINMNRATILMRSISNLGRKVDICEFKAVLVAQ